MKNIFLKTLKINLLKSKYKLNSAQYLKLQKYNTDVQIMGLQKTF